MAAPSGNQSRPWANLPADILKTIVRLLEIFSTAQLAAVCTSWAGAVETDTSLPFSRPCLLLSREEKEDGDDQEAAGEDGDYTYGLLDIPTTLRHAATFPAVIRAVRSDVYAGRWWAGAKGDWLATVERDGYNPQLINPYTGKHIDLPAITTIPGVESVGSDGIVRRRRDLLKIVVCETPSGGDEDYLVMAHFSGALLTIARGGDPSWTALKNPRKVWNYDDAIVVAGKAFALHSYYYSSFLDIYSWDLRNAEESPEPPERVLPPQVDREFDIAYQWNLAASADGRRLLLVCTHDSYVPVCEERQKLREMISPTTYDDSVHLYEMDPSHAAPEVDGWSPVTSLGDQALFIGANFPLMARVSPGSPDQCAA